MKKINQQIFITTCQNSLTMAEAARKLGMHFNTFKRYAVKLGCYATNPSGKGIPKPRAPEIISSAICGFTAPIAIRYKNTIGQRIEQIARDDYTECQ